MLLTCPICHVRYSLEAILQDEAARELLSLSGQAGRAWPGLVKYLGLFRSDTRPLAWDRALKLAKEVLEITADQAALETALAETVEALRAKGGKALKNHNYLKRVLENTTCTALSSIPLPQGEGGQRPGEGASKTARAIGRLENWKRG